MNKEIKIDVSQQRSGDHNRRCPDIGKLINSVGEFKFISLNEGIKNMTEN
tara:strand:+ start:1055 stop:1204 length:150 start_codon:yes stop_codon:yes gene_type:complete